MAVLVIASLTTFGLHRTSGSRAGAGTKVSYDSATKVLVLTLPAFRGGVVSTAALAGKPAVVNFYASWCEVCYGEMPDFEKAHKQIG
jgi:thiol-disulfide isomerase/thioredoxin